MGERLKLHTIIILLLFRMVFPLAEKEINSIRAKTLALRNLALYAENNQESNCGDKLINEILYYLEVGLEDIERTDVKDVIIVLGASGVGKSTLSQFVANETNTLRAECQWGHCMIIDDSGTIGYDIISKTFLPNLVFHESNQIPFYDMPGFNDNRNESIEIANAFFMQQILDEAETIKILVLARHASFFTHAKHEFLSLLQNLVELIKSPAKFRGGMAIVSTIVPANLDHINIIGHNTQFLKEELLEKINEIFYGQEEYIRGSTEILENWLESDTGNYYDAKYFSYFLSPSNTGLLLEDPILVKNKEFLDEVIWDRLQFVPKESNDFGLPLSAGALRQLEKIGSCISNNLASTMKIFANDLKSNILNKLLDVINGNEADLPYIYELLTNLTSSDFSFANMEGQPLSDHLQKLLNELSKLEISSSEKTRQQISDTLSIIKFIELTKAEFDFSPSSWVENLLSIESNLILQMGLQADKLLDAAITSLTSLAKITADFLVSSIELLSDISEKEALAYLKINTVNDMFEKISLEKQIPGKKLTDFLALYLSEYDKLRGCNSCSGIKEFNVLSVLQILDDFSWYKKDWISTSTYKLQNPLEMEKDLTIFLQALFIDLSQPIIQTGGTTAIHSWWNNSQKQLNVGNFEALFDFIDNTKGFNTTKIFGSDKSRVREFVFYTTSGTKRLELLLGMMLDAYNCTNSSELIVTAPIISFDRMASCIRKEETTSIILLATFKIYANSDIIGREIHANNNIDVIMMSPEIFSSRNAQINLSGKAGEQGVSGRPAGTQYSLFQKISSSDGSSTNTITFPNVSGGSGVDGVVGKSGLEGLPGINDFSANSRSDHCAAWSGGYIQIRKFVNTCNQCTDDKPQCYCHAPDNGVDITIYGWPGKVGENGKPGTAGSCGGAGGQSYSINANDFMFPKTPVNGIQGKNGVGGNGGEGGLGGRYGETHRVTIDDLGGPKYCWEGYRHTTVSNARANAGSPGQKGASCTSQVPRKSVSQAAVTRHFNSFKAALGRLATNEFISLQASHFLSLVRDVPPL